MVNFNNSHDYAHAMENGPWMIYDHHLKVRMLCPDFNPWTLPVEKVMVWVRFSHLPLEYYDELILKTLGNRIGRVVKVYKQLSKRKFVRLCLVVELEKPSITNFD